MPTVPSSCIPTSPLAIPTAQKAHTNPPAFPKITNAVAHECHLHPVYDENYERILRARRLENEVSRRPIQHMEDYATQGRINQLSSGHAAIRSSFGTGMASLVSRLVYVIGLGWGLVSELEWRGGKSKGGTVWIEEVGFAG